MLTNAPECLGHIGACFGYIGTWILELRGITEMILASSPFLLSHGLSEELFLDEEFSFLGMRNSQGRSHRQGCGRGWGGGAKVLAAVRRGTGSRCSARERRPPSGRSAANQDSNHRLKTAAPSSPKLGKAGAGSQWSSHEETDSVGGHRRDARRRALAPHPLCHPLAEPRSFRAPQAVERLAGPQPEVENLEKKKCQPY